MKIRAGWGSFRAAGGRFRAAGCSTLLFLFMENTNTGYFDIYFQQKIIHKNNQTVNIFDPDQA